MKRRHSSLKRRSEQGTYREKIARICELTLENFESAITADLFLHDNDLRIGHGT